MRIKNMEEKFESFEEFVDYISRGGELEFKYKGEEYCVLPTNKYIYISKQYDEKSEKIYSTPEEVGKYLIGNESIKDIITNVEVIMRLF